MARIVFGILSLVFVFSNVAASASAQCPVDWGGLGIGMDGSVNALALYNDKLIAGGNFSIAGDVSANHIAAWDAIGWQELGTGLDGPVYALTVYNGELIAGGSFTIAGGVSAYNIARWNGASWAPLGTGTYDSVYALAIYNGELIASGNCGYYGPESVCNVYRWNGASWQPILLGGVSEDSEVYVTALTTYGGELIAGGSFGANIARWNGTIWQELGSGIIGSGGLRPVVSLTVHNGELIAGGHFTTAGGENANGIARWNGTSWQPLGTGVDSAPYPGPGVYALTVYNGDLIAGGEFTTAGGENANGIARWNGSTWQALGTGTNGFVSALSEYNGALIAGGWFTTAGGHVSAYLARWGPTCPPGDMDCNNVIDTSDVPHFVEALVATGTFTGCDIARADMNADMLIDGRDTQPFAAALLAP